MIVAGGTESMSMVPMGGNKISPNPWLVDNYPDAYINMGLGRKISRGIWDYARGGGCVFGEFAQESGGSDCGGSVCGGDGGGGSEERFGADEWKWKPNPRTLKPEGCGTQYPKQNKATTQTFTLTKMNCRGRIRAWKFWRG